MYGIGRGVSLNLQSGLELLMVINKQLGGEKLNVKLHSIRLVGELLATAQGIQGRVNIRFHISGQRPGGPGDRRPGPGWVTGRAITTRWNIGACCRQPAPGYLWSWVRSWWAASSDWRGGPTEKYAGLLAAKLWSLEIIAFGVHEKLPSGRLR